MIKPAVLDLLTKVKHKCLGDSLLFNFIEEAHFTQGLSPDESKRLFKKSICLVEIETFSYCNRKCWFCPNSVIDRQTKNIYFDNELYKKLLFDLQSIDYDKTLTCSRYNEPLADNSILRWVSLARQFLPKASLHLNTNGDYLTRAFLDKLHDAGLNSIIVMAYPDNERSYDDKKTGAACMRLMERIQMSLPLIKYMPGEYIHFFGKFKGMHINLEGRNFLVNGVDRGGLVDIPSARERTLPCIIPFKRITMDYNGSVMPCCNLRSDHPDHEAYVLSIFGGENNNIFEIYTSRKYVDWRRELIRCGPKNKPCNTCHFAEHQPPKKRGRFTLPYPLMS